MIKKLATLAQMYKDLGDTPSYNSYKYLIKKAERKEIKESDLQDWVQDDLAMLSDEKIHNAFDKVGDDIDLDKSEMSYEKDIILGYLDNLMEQVEEGLEGGDDPETFRSVLIDVIANVEEHEEPFFTDSDLDEIKKSFDQVDRDIVSEIVELIKQNTNGTEMDLDEDEDEEEFNRYEEQIQNAVQALSKLGLAPSSQEIRQEIEELFYSDESQEKDPQTHLDDIVESLWDKYTMQSDDDTMLDTSSDTMPPTSSLSALERKRLEDASDPFKNYPHFSKGFGSQPVAEASIIQDLIKLADSLDKKDLVEEADFVDNLINSIQRG